MTGPPAPQEVERKLSQGVYRDPEEMNEDMELIWANCRTYNPVGDLFRRMGDQVRRLRRGSRPGQEQGGGSRGCTSWRGPWPCPHEEMRVCWCGL